MVFFAYAQNKIILLKLTTLSVTHAHTYLMNADASLHSELTAT